MYVPWNHATLMNLDLSLYLYMYDGCVCVSVYYIYCACIYVSKGGNNTHSQMTPRRAVIIMWRAGDP